ncbi:MULTISPECIES: Fe2+-enterobactin ABC transporter substrate-binding protein [unclassified Luteococcus]|uniref:Fe2+-enterobactin ABC transporter substrate-binding protein n=1 Tax=unclassified Luteococcus TaxID=2639923 RepID=UPI00313D573F
MNSVLRRLQALLACCLLLAIAACSAGSSTKESTTGAPAASSGVWPRTITHKLGTTTIPSRPQRVVSTSMVLTGSLLAMDAPVIGTGASKPGAIGLDDQGLFTHWAPKAKEKGVKVLFKNQQLDLEAITAAKPDLIYVSVTGGDSFADSYAQLARIAPTVAVDYNTVGWKETVKELGASLGMEQQATDVVADYDAKVSALKSKVKAPAEPVQMIVFNPSNGSAFAKPGGPHEAVLKDLGLTLDATDLDKLGTNEGGKGRGDFTFLSEENSIAALTAKTVLLVSGTEDDVRQIKASTTYQKIPAAQADGRLVPLGLPSFKLDYYSALDMAEHLAKAFGA